MKILDFRPSDSEGAKLEDDKLKAIKNQLLRADWKLIRINQIVPQDFSTNKKIVQMKIYKKFIGS